VEADVYLVVHARKEEEKDRDGIFCDNQILVLVLVR